MKTFCKLTLAILSLGAFASGSAFGGTTIVSDNFTASNTNSGFAFGEGINSGINPPITRMTGSAASGLHYIRKGNKGDTVYTISGNKVSIAQGAQSGRFTISDDGTNPFDFAPALGLGAATPANPVIYDVVIAMDNNVAFNGATVGRMSFAFGTVEGGGGTWSFGIQILPTSNGNYNVFKRIKTTASGLGAELNSVITNAGANASEVSFLMRVTDAGAESGGNYHSRVQVSMDGGTTFFYDTAADASLTSGTSGFRFDTGTRYCSWDQAPSSGSDVYDSFSIKTGATWAGGAGNNNWSSAANWESSLPATALDENMVFAGTTRLTPSMNNDYSVRMLLFDSSAGSFTISASAGKILTLKGDIFQNSSNPQILNTPVAIPEKRTINTTSGNLTIGGIISGAGGITKSGSSILTLSADNIYTGATTNNAGMLSIGAGGISGSVASASIENNAELTFNRSDALAYSGTIAGTGNLTKSGAGALTLSAANTFSGNTAINAGSVRVSNISGSALGSGNVTIASGAMLSGTGSVSGSVANAGTLSPGASPGTLSTGSEDWLGGGAYIWEINDATGTAGANPGWDKIAINGGLNISATSGSKFTINITSFGGDAANFDNSLDQSWVIVTTTDGITNFNVNSFILVDNFSNDQGTGIFNLAAVGNDLVLKFIHPPTITTQPASATKTIGESVAFSVDSDATTYQWRMNGMEISGATDSSYMIPSVALIDAGGYDVVVGNLSGTIASSVATLTVNKINQSINFGTLGNKIYGDTDFGVSATADSGLPVNFSIASGPATIIGGTNVHLTGVGSVTVRASQSGNTNYNAATEVDQIFNVAKASLAVSAVKTNVYGSTPVLTPTYTGFISPDTAGSSLTGAPVLNTSATATSPVSGSPYTITVAAGDLASDNYDFTFNDGTLTQNPAILTVTAANTNRFYNTANPAFTYSYSGFVNGEDETVLTGSPLLTTTADNTSLGGNYPITTALGTLAANDGNYTFNLVDGILTITKIGLTVTMNNTNRVYGATNSFTATYSGFVNGDTEAVVSGAPDFTTGATTNSPVTGSPYTVTPSLGTLTSDSYDFTTFVAGQLAITKAPLTVTADLTKTYGATNPLLEPTYIGLANNETAAVLTGSPILSTTADTNSTVIGSPYVVTVDANDLASDNYQITAVDGTLAVSPAALIVTVDGTNRVYGASNPAFTASYGGFVNNETMSVLTGNPDLTTVANANSSVSGNPYAITATNGTLAADNYTFSFVDGELAITSANLNVIADSTNRVYGAANPAFTASFVGFVNGEDESVLTGSPGLTTTATAGSSVGGHVIATATGTLVANGGNYSFSFIDGTLTVNAAGLTITSDSTNRVYGASNPTFTGSLSGIQNGDNITVAYGTTAVAGSSIGDYIITQTLIDPNTKLGNYVVTTNSGTLTVTAAGLTITSDSTNRVYGASNPTFTGSLIGLQNGDNITASYSTSADTGSSAGSYEITQTLIDPDTKLSNYTVTTNNGTLTISGATLTIISDNTNRVYGTSNPTFAGSLVGLQNGDNITATYSTTADTNSSVGDYTITQTLSDPDTKLGNYTVTTNDGMLTVTVASLTVTADNKTRGAGQSNPTFTGVITGIQNKDNITATYDTDADTGSPAGNYAIIPTLVDLDIKLGNYNVTTNHGMLSVLDVPVITTQPTNVAAGLLATATFSVTATGSGTLTYQWRHEMTNIADGGIITGAASSTLTLTGVTGANEGNYDVIVSNEVGSVTSSNATLTLVGGVTITNQPASLGALDQGDSATFSVGAAGGALTYQWYFGAAPISGATDSSYTRTNVQQSDAGVGFTVVVSNPGGSVTSAPPATILAVIADNEIPKVTVTTPGKKKGTNSSTITITGVAKDTGSGIIRDVKYILNEGAQSSVVSLSEIKPGQWSFASAVETLNAGVNTLSLWALDLAGNPSLTNTFEFYYDTTNDLVLHIEGQGNVKMGTSVYSGATTLLTNTFKVGRSYKLDAFVGKGTNYIFTNWVTEPNDLGSSTNKWVQKSSLTFIMQSNMVITAKFNANPFTPVAGTYNGLFSETGGITHETAGFIQVKAKDKATYSGFLLFGGVKRPFSGKFLTDGTATGLVIRTKTTNQPPVNLAFALDLTPGETISGTVSATNGAWSSTITADKAVFSLSNPETNNLGSYTLQIPTSPGAPTSSPGGVGYSTVTNNPLGVAKFGGYLSDNQKITLSMNLTRDGHVPFYVGLYKTAAPKDFRGSLMGWLTFTNGEFGLGSDNVLTWIKQGNSEATAQYAAGFSNSVEVAGSKYVAPAPGIVPVKTGDYVIVSEGNLTDPVTNVVTAVAPTATGTKVTLSKTNTLGVENKATITFKAKDGTVTGGFNNPADKTKTQGIWLQNTTNVSGYFLKTGHTESGTFRVEQIIP